jgi:hypothetical protein
MKCRSRAGRCQETNDVRHAPCPFDPKVFSWQSPWCGRRRFWKAAPGPSGSAAALPADASGASESQRPVVCGFQPTIAAARVTAPTKSIRARFVPGTASWDNWPGGFRLRRDEARSWGLSGPPVGSPARSTLSPKALFRPLSGCELLSCPIRMLPEIAVVRNPGPAVSNTGDDVPDGGPARIDQTLRVDKYQDLMPGCVFLGAAPVLPRPWAAMPG